MDGIPENLEKFLDEHYEMPPIRRDKCITMYQLACIALKGGVIVELGSFHGNGTISLCYGTKDGNNLSVHTIDQYEDWSDWIGEKYSRKDLEIFSENIMLASV